MNAEVDNLWWMVVVVTGAVSPAMFIYGVRQKEPLPLVFGILFGIVPMVVSSGVAAAAVSVGLGVLFYVMRKYSWLD